NYTVSEDEESDGTAVGSIKPVFDQPINNEDLKILAITPALIGYISAQTMNGENEEDASQGNSADVIMGDGAMTSEGWAYPTDSPSRACGFDCYGGHRGMDIPGKSIGDPFYAIRDGVVTQAGV